VKAFAAVPAVLLALSLGACGGLNPFGGSSKATGACADAAAPDPALLAPIDRYAMDQWLLDGAVRREVNRQRCKRGLVPLAEDPGLSRAASLHSGDMVVHEFFDHASPVAGRATPADRLALTGVQWTRLAENIATLSIYDFRDKHFIVRDAANCDFAFSRGGPAIKPRTYAGAAEALVDAWMDSSGHRRNILKPDMTRVGTGAAVKPDPQVCGELVVVQNFAG
jgi:uncharacterized protein YkwD